MTTLIEDSELIDKFLRNELSMAESDLFILRASNEPFRLEVMKMQQVKKVIFLERRKDLRTKLNVIHNGAKRGRGPIILTSLVAYAVAACFVIGIGIGLINKLNSESNTYYSHTGGAGIVKMND